MTFRNHVDGLFGITDNGSTVMKECYAGLLLFLTVSYIILVNPYLMMKAGMDWYEAYSATCISAAIGTVIIGVYANNPCAMIPTMGLNSLFTYTVVITLGYTWQQALALSFIAGAIFLVLVCVKGIRETVYRAFTPDLCRILIASIGAFIIVVGLKEGGILHMNGGYLGIGDLASPDVAICVIGVIVIVLFSFVKIKGSMLFGIIAATVAGICMGAVEIPSSFVDIPTMPPIGKFIEGFNGLTLDVNSISTIIAVLVISVFDAHGCIVAVANKDGHDDQGTIDKMTVANAASNLISTTVGTSPVNICAESMVAHESGGRTGLTNIVVALLFVGALFLMPMFSTLTISCIAPVVIAVGAIMLCILTTLENRDVATVVAAAVSIVFMVIGNSIIIGIGLCLISYCAVKILKRETGSVSMETYVLAIVFALFFVLMAMP